MPKEQYQYTGWDAYPALFSSLVYLLKHPQYGIVLYFIIGSFGGRFAWNEITHWTGMDIQIVGKAKPVDVQEDGSFKMPNGENSGRWRFMLIPEAHAQDRSRTWKSENAIVIDQKFYEFEDSRFKLYKRENKNEILIYYKPTKTALWWQAESGMFDPDKYKQ